MASAPLSDPARRAVERQGLIVPAVVVTDRYGEILAAWIGGEAHRLPTGQDVASWLELGAQVALIGSLATGLSIIALPIYRVTLSI